jgi:uncharacterized protein (DUF302 family)
MNTPVMSSPGLHQVIEGAFEPTYERICTALKAADFAIMAEVSLTDFVTEKSHSYSRQCKIVVVCNADIAYKALTITPDAAAMMLCNVAVSETQADQVEVRVADPHLAWNTAFNVYLKPVAEELRTRLERIIAALQ